MLPAPESFLQEGIVRDGDVVTRVRSARTYLAKVIQTIHNWRMLGFEHALQDAAKNGQRISYLNIGGKEYDFVPMSAYASAALGCMVLQAFDLPSHVATGFIHTNNMVVWWAWAVTDVEVEGKMHRLITDVIPQTLERTLPMALGDYLELSAEVEKGVDMYALLGIPTCSEQKYERGAAHEGKKQVINPPATWKKMMRPIQDQIDAGEWGVWDARYWSPVFLKLRDIIQADLYSKGKSKEEGAGAGAGGE